MKNNVVKYLLLLSLCVGLFACDVPPVIEASGKVYKIAFVGDGQGATEQREQDLLEGILAANAADSMLDNGDELVITHGRPADGGKWNAGDIAQVISEYIERDKVSAILLGARSKSVLPVKHDIDALGIPALAMIATHPEVITEVEFISQLSFDDKRQGQAAALFVRDELGYTRVAVFFDDTDPYSGYLGQEFRTTFEQTGGHVEEFTVFSQLNQIMLEDLKKKGTQMIYMPLGVQQVFYVLEQLAILNWEPDIMGADGLLAAAVQAYPERVEELNGVYVTDLYSHTNEFVSMAKYVKRIAGFHEQMFHEQSSTHTGLGVEAYRVIKSAMNLCPDRHNMACINRKIRSIKNQQGVISRFSILDNGKASRPIYINTIQSGRLNLVVKVN